MLAQAVLEVGYAAFYVVAPVAWVLGTGALTTKLVMAFNRARGGAAADPIASALAPALLPAVCLALMHQHLVSSASREVAALALAGVHLAGMVAADRLMLDEHEYSAARVRGMLWAACAAVPAYRAALAAR